MSKSICVHCGKPYGHRRTMTRQMKWPSDQPEPRHNFAPLRLVAQDKARQTTDDHHVRTVTLWDGKSYAGGYPPFCTLRCALSFARMMHTTALGKRAGVAS